MKKFMEEFKEFIARGDVMSMAVGIIIGGAFTAIVNSLVSDINTPIIGMVTGGIDFTGVCLSVGEANIMLGNFIQAVIVFLITALVVFSMMKTFNRLLAAKDREKADAADTEAAKVEAADVGAAPNAEESEISPELTLNKQTLTVLEDIRDLLSEGKN